MSRSKADLIVHPVRLRILQSLVNQKRTTQEIADALADVAKSSIYRHLRKLLEGEMIAVTETRPVRGVEEKVYTLTRSARLKGADLMGITVEEHIRYFSTYVVTLLQGFSTYIEGSAELDFIADRTGYSEVTFYASPAEFDGLQRALNQALLPLLQNAPGAGRQRRKLATITHPILDQKL